MKKALVSGGAGFIGSNLVRRLLARDYRVVVVDNLSTGNLDNLADVLVDIDFFRADVRDKEAILEAIRGVDVVFHQAALPSVARSVDDPWQSNDVNVNGTLNLLLCSRDAGVKRFVYAASSSAYGDTATLPKHEAMVPNPLSPYAVGKLVGEHYCQVFSRLYGMEAVALRYFNVFGPHQNPNSQYAAVVPKFITSLLNGYRPIVFGDGRQTRDFTYIDNVVAANIAAATVSGEKVAGRVFNVGCGDRIALNKVLSLLQEILGTNLTPLFESSRPGDVRDSQADVGAAKEALGYRAEVDVEEGLRRTAHWFRANLTSKQQSK